jgi:hypothetical protein
MRKQISNLLIIAGLSSSILFGLKSYNTSKELNVSSTIKYKNYDPIIVYSTISSLSLVAACAGIASKPNN